MQKQEHDTVVKTKPFHLMSFNLEATRTTTPTTIQSQLPVATVSKVITFLLWIERENKILKYNSQNFDELL